MSKLNLIYKKAVRCGVTELNAVISTTACLNFLFSRPANKSKNTFFSESFGIFRNLSELISTFFGCLNPVNLFLIAIKIGDKQMNIWLLTNLGLSSHSLLLSEILRVFMEANRLPSQNFLQ